MIIIVVPSILAGKNNTTMQISFLIIALAAVARKKELL